MSIPALIFSILFTIIVGKVIFLICKYTDSYETISTKIMQWEERYLSLFTVVSWGCGGEGYFRALTEKEALYYIQKYGTKINDDPLLRERLKAAMLGDQLVRRFQFNYLSRYAPEKFEYSRE